MMKGEVIIQNALMSMEDRRHLGWNKVDLAGND